jgi:protein-L-isoaspartate(D-aspartate) O-methyltransferase
VDEAHFQEEREKMVQTQIEKRQIHEPRLLEALRKVPRHRFIDAKLAGRAYDDGPLPIGFGQTISQPYIVAIMTELLNLKGSENILEIGTGSGYQAAVLGELAKSVHTVERLPKLAAHAEKILDGLGYANVSVHVGDGSLGWPAAAPYQGILVTAAAPKIVQAWIDQMDEAAALIVPVGGQGEQRLERWRKHNGQLYCESFFPVSFVPLRGQFGWQEDEWGSHDIFHA